MRCLCWFCRLRTRSLVEFLCLLAPFAVLVVVELSTQRTGLATPNALFSFAVSVGRDELSHPTKISKHSTLTCPSVLLYVCACIQVQDKERKKLRKFRAKAGIDAQEHLLALEKQASTKAQGSGPTVHTIVLYLCLSGAGFGRTTLGRVEAAQQSPLVPAVLRQVAPLETAVTAKYCCRFAVDVLVNQRHWSRPPRR